MAQKIIFLADDDSDDTEMFCEALANIDDTIICHTAINGSELLRKLQELDQKPDLIFLDLNMPIMNGWECLKLIKENQDYRQIPVIMISTSSHKKEMDIAMSLGALCYFVKPSNFNELTKVLQVITANLGNGLTDAILNMQTSGYRHIFNCNDSKS